jgi:hypothetical protein
MIISILPVVFIGLCFFIMVLIRRAEGQLKEFLERNPSIADERSLNEYKAVVRLEMHSVLILIGSLIAAVCVISIVIWFKGISGALPIPLLAVAIASGKELGKLEEKARSLNCANRDLERRYKEISQIWQKKALPNF